MTTLHTDRPALRADLAHERRLFRDDRLEPVLRGLAGPEAEVALRWAVDGEGWEQAAAGAGLPQGYGERVRHKLKRLGARHCERAAAAKAAQALPTARGIGR
ncbi:hypothetical protein [Actinacidiphila guanduensis]|uniref:Uncharacterized protein n=1 Tax=Actinacidiphila guanduensis TaxID=310781 RepID=A0A1G9UVU1_9ACTN|nr:hypothetical protein [Actinacidiphila guanduensis]SDM64052.1 hypothetical protein SAMN05216259_10117 [Actinacidiphila guanduensis]